MARFTIRADFDGKAIIPDEAVSLSPSQRLILHIVMEDGTEESALNWLAENAVDDASIPTDLARQHDHHVYRAPRKP